MVCTSMYVVELNQCQVYSRGSRHRSLGDKLLPHMYSSLSIHYCALEYCYSSSKCNPSYKGTSCSVSSSSSDSWSRSTMSLSLQKDEQAREEEDMVLVSLGAPQQAGLPTMGRDHPRSPGHRQGCWCGICNQRPHKLSHQAQQDGSVFACSGI
jgi:hypothetical protein